MSNMMQFGSSPRLAAKVGRATLFMPLMMLLAPAGLGQSPDAPPRSPQDSLKLLHVRDGFRAELVAAEPLIADPVAIDWAPDGSMWVVEMADYPLGMDGQGSPGGRVRRLRDTDGDGQYDRSQLFMDGIAFPTGILSWGNGVLVTAAPLLFYAEDTDSDGKADVRHVLLSGFLEGNQQLRVNGLRWGLDNWVHCASGSHHGGYGEDRQIKSQLTNETVPLGSRDFRFRPDTGEIDPQSGPSQYGRNRDDWGNWFGVQNSHPLWHYVLADHNIRRNPHFAGPDPRHQVVVPTNPPVYPAKSPQKRFHSFDQSGRFTSACSAIVYRDELLFERGAAQHAFTCEPFHNLVQHNILVEDGVSFRSYRDPDEDEVDFFASEDRWCRPVMARTGPDGSLWVVDMYRYMIEHPQWLPEEGQEELRPFYRSGDDRGRIYKIVRDNRAPSQIVSVDEMTAEQLVLSLESSNGWLRDMAHRQLVLTCAKRSPEYRSAPQRNDATAAVPALERLLESSGSALARLHALCVLDGLDALRPRSLLIGLDDPHAAVRRHAVRLAKAAGIDVSPLVPRANDPDVKVRLELATALGAFDENKAAEAMITLSQNSVDNPYIIAALLSSVNAKNLPELTRRAIELPGGTNDFVAELFAQVAAFGEPSTVAQVIGHASGPMDDRQPSWWMDVLADVLDRLERRGWQEDEWLGAAQRMQLGKTIDAARNQAGDPEIEASRRSAAVRLLLREAKRNSTDMKLLAGLLVPQTPPVVQQAVVAHLGRRPDEEIAEVLLADWKSHSPSMRAQIVSVLVTRQPWIDELVDRIESGAVAAGELDAATRRRLVATSNVTGRTRLERILGQSSAPDRGRVVNELQSVLNMAGDRDRGEMVFRKKCSTCHKHGGFGYEVGPDLLSLTDKSSGSLLASLLDPSRAVEAKYLEYVVVVDDGRTMTGMMATETGSSVTLLAAEGKRVSLLRNQIEALQSTGKSLMPDGLEKDLTPQDLADVIKFMQTMPAPD